MKIKLIILSFILVHSLCAANIYITSDSVELDGQANVVIASGNVIVAQRDITLKSNYVTYNQETQIAHLYNGVSLIKENLKMTCDTAIAYGVENIIDAEGSIVVLYETIKATAKHAHFDVTTHLVTLTGNPIAFHDGGTITGESIVVDLDRVKVTTLGQAKVNINLEKL